MELEKLNCGKSFIFTSKKGHEEAWSLNNRRSLITSCFTSVVVSPLRKGYWEYNQLALLAFISRRRYMEWMVFHLWIRSNRACWDSRSRKLKCFTSCWRNSCAWYTSWKSKFPLFIAHLCTSPSLYTHNCNFWTEHTWSHVNIRSFHFAGMIWFMHWSLSNSLLPLLLWMERFTIYSKKEGTTLL